MARKFRIIPVLFLILAALAFSTGSSFAGGRGLETELAGFLPQAGEIAEWRRTSEPRFYEPENLF
ncbi:hypothetical protein JW906_15300, partial [bacterium]|nr:hypothetical protein [bacterium]